MMKKIISIFCVLAAGILINNSAYAGSCDTTPNYNVKVTENWRGTGGTPRCLQRGKRYYATANCRADNHAYILHILGNSSPLFAAFDCGGTKSFTVSHNPDAGPYLTFQYTPTCTGRFSDANYAHRKTLTVDLCN